MAWLKCLQTEYDFGRCENNSVDKFPENILSLVLSKQNIFFAVCKQIADLSPGKLSITNEI